MPNVEFDTDKEFKPLDFSEMDRPSGLIQFLIRKRLASNAKQANIILVAVGLTAVILTLIVLYGGGAADSQNVSLPQNQPAQLLRE
ncbi:MAG TPA: hypothetical protein VJH55_03390 [Candidatus Paceibacterota bacterium]